MQSCRIHLCVLFFLTLTFTPVLTQDFSSVTVKLNESAVLPCEKTCSGSLKWTVIDKPNITLAQCNNTSCWSKKGFNISYDQYLKGNLSLTITAANYSNRGLYSCECDCKDIISTVHLSIEPRTLFVNLKPGNDLVLDLHMPGQMKVSYKSKDSSDPYGEQICNATQHSVQCKDEYTKRVSLRDADLILMKVMPSDSGVYTIWDKKTNDINLNYIVSVKENQVVPFIVKRHESVTLPCTLNCSDLGEWIHRNKVVAWCNSTSCGSLQSYKMSHEQYMKGDLSLNITVDCYSMRGLYQCKCNATQFDPQHVIIEAENSSVQLKPGDDLLMELPLTESVEVIYNGSIIWSNNPPNKTQENAHRILHILKLEKVNVTDFGIYTVRDMNTKEVFFLYNVSMKGKQPSPDRNQELCSKMMIVIVVLSLTVFILSLFIILYIGICQRCKQNGQIPSEPVNDYRQSASTCCSVRCSRNETDVSISSQLLQ